MKRAVPKADGLDPMDLRQQSVVVHEADTSPVVLAHRGEPYVRDKRIGFRPDFNPGVKG